ncbi:MAG: metallophosphoesterase [Armatimonadetes bacterium]|nr:metallophosphoesterase [Armatimonadota bacterium]
MNLSRRDVLAAGAASLLPLKALGALEPPQKTLRVAHMTDFHVQPELHAAEGMAKALEHAMGRKPGLILAGGDLIMDGFAQTEARTKLQWELFTKISRDHAGVSIHPAMGNHDVWGWNKKDSHTDGSERLWAKKWFTDLFHLERTYYSFDKGAWHFVVLDDIALTPDGYNGMVGPEQREWLADDLAKTKKPTVVLSHIPILSVTGLAGGYDQAKGEWNVGGSTMAKDSNELRALFFKNKHVKIALSGHTHVLDRVDFDGVSYLCGGAVCGAWWKGNNGNTKPGYRLLDLHSDGSFDERYVPWGWKPA